jgi:hypothetical protein
VIALTQSPRACSPVSRTEVRHAASWEKPRRAEYARSHQLNLSENGAHGGRVAIPFSVPQRGAIRAAMLSGHNLNSATALGRYPHTGKSGAPAATTASARGDTSGTAVSADHRAVNENPRGPATNYQFAEGSHGRLVAGCGADPERRTCAASGARPGARASDRPDFRATASAAGGRVVRPTAEQLGASRDDDGGKTPGSGATWIQHSENAGKLAQASDRNGHPNCLVIRREPGKAGTSARRDRGESSATNGPEASRRCSAPLSGGDDAGNVARTRAKLTHGNPARQGDDGSNPARSATLVASECRGRQGRCTVPREGNPQSRRAHRSPGEGSAPRRACQFGSLTP